MSSFRVALLARQSLTRFEGMKTSLRVFVEAVEIALIGTRREVNAVAFSSA